MKLYYSPGACSLGIHLLLEEIGAPYEAIRVSTRSGELQQSPFIDLNPKGKVPTLQRDDGGVITEYPVMAHWLAKTNPAAGLLPQGDEAALRAAETVDYVVSTVHMQGFTRLFRPGNFSPNESEHEAVKMRGREIVDKAFTLLDKSMAGRDWVGGSYSYADSALFYVEFWGVKRLEMQLPPHLAAHYDRMMVRPAVQRMIEQEGL